MLGSVLTKASASNPALTLYSITSKFVDQQQSRRDVLNSLQDAPNIEIERGSVIQSTVIEWAQQGLSPEADAKARIL
jgi:hypothetical protein